MNGLGIFVICAYGFFVYALVDILFDKFLTRNCFSKILSYIDECNHRIDYRDLINWCVENKCLSVLKNNYDMVSDYLLEHNSSFLPIYKDNE